MRKELESRATFNIKAMRSSSWWQNFKVYNSQEYFGGIKN